MVCCSNVNKGRSLFQSFVVGSLALSLWGCHIHSAHMHMDPVGPASINMTSSLDNFYQQDQIIVQMQTETKKLIGHLELLVKDLKTVDEGDIDIEKQEGFCTKVSSYTRQGLQRLRTFYSHNNRAITTALGVTGILTIYSTIVANYFWQLYYPLPEEFSTQFNLADLCIPYDDDWLFNNHKEQSPKHRFSINDLLDRRLLFLSCRDRDGKVFTIHKQAILDTLIPRAVDICERLNMRWFDLENNNIDSYKDAIRLYNCRETFIQKREELINWLQNPFKWETIPFTLFMGGCAGMATFFYMKYCNRESQHNFDSLSYVSTLLKNLKKGIQNSKKCSFSGQVAILRKELQNLLIPLKHLHEWVEQNKSTGGKAYQSTFERHRPAISSSLENLRKRSNEYKDNASNSKDQIETMLSISNHIDTAWTNIFKQLSTDNQRVI